ncbi:MAG: acetyl-CoA carboxylase biotin carboxyl carrier protein [Acidobacteria bacterium]|nr:acetyl-CoA carboxylase biotin carboxyl carrier protein [Acidobacteriota bacterium]
MQLSDIRRLLDAFENSDWDEIRLSVDGVDVFISADEHAAAMVPATPPLVRSATVAAPPVPVTTPAAPAVVADVPPGVAVTSPSPGIFWRSPAPGTPPFVEIGQHVEAGTPVCIVEVMKLMNRVIAGVSGRVLAVPVDNSAKVERGQVLVVIDPDQPGTC